MIPGSSNPLLLASAAEAGAYTIERSLRFNSADSAYLSRTPASAGNRDLWTLSLWVKRSKLGTTQDVFSAGTAGTDILYFNSSDQLCLDRPGATVLVTTQVFRDASAWYHIVLRIDSTNGTTSNKAKLYVNGSEISAFSTDNRSALSASSFLTNTAILHRIGIRSSSLVNACDLYFADVHLIDGQALDPTSFGEFDATTGVWNPKAYIGSYPGNSFHLDFADNSSAAALGYDAAGSNDWTVNNLSVTAGAGNDSLRDSPTNGDTANDTGLGGQVPGNYCTWNPLTKGTYTNGNLDSSNTTYQIGTGTIGVSSGKWYWEVAKTDSGTTHTIAGITPLSYSTAEYIGLSANGYGLYFFNGNLIYNGSGSGAYGAFSQNDILNVALDLDNGKVWFGKNGTWFNSGNPAAGTNALGTGLTGTWYPGVSSASGTVTTTLNAGARAFSFAAPSGFKALCTANLPTPTIEDPSTVMDVVTYTGNGSTQTISGLNLSPDLVWIKGRSLAADHGLFDIVRGTTKRLVSNATQAEDTQSGVTAFNSDGFDLGSYAGQNQSSSTYVGWCWDAGSSTVSNTQGSITSSVRANATAGFSVCTITTPSSPGAYTFGHGLNAAPQLVIYRIYDQAMSWYTWHTSLGAANKYLLLNSTNAVSSGTYVFNNTYPTSSLITDYASNTLHHNEGRKMLYYCFAPVAGYSAFGSFVGAGNTDVFVHLGFRPKLLMIKCSSYSDAYTSWFIADSARSSYNPAGGATTLWANKSINEGYRGDGSQTANLAAINVDLLSNGFNAVGDNSTEITNTGQTFIYAAFAESPFAYARAR